MSLWQRDAIPLTPQTFPRVMWVNTKKLVSSVQPCWRLLDTNRQTDRQNIYMKHLKMWTCVNKNSTTDLQQSFTTLALSSLEAELFLDLNSIFKSVIFQATLHAKMPMPNLQRLETFIWSKMWKMLSIF